MDLTREASVTQQAAAPDRVTNGHKQQMPTMATLLTLTLRKTS